MFSAWLEGLDYQNAEIDLDDLETEREAQELARGSPTMAGCESKIRERH